MNKLLLSLTILMSLSLVSSAAEGDTTRIESHQATHWNWYGNFYDTVQFPDTGSYRKILMYYTIGCPSIGCSGWDYTTQIEVSDAVNDSTTRWVELTRVITPYAGNKTSAWHHTWIFDVTDFAPLLKGERQILAKYSGYQDGFTITVNFDFIEGIPPREVLDINTIYDGTFKYGFANDPIESHLIPTEIPINANTESSKFRLVASGHSFGGNENCAEFCPKWYKLKVDGVVAKQEDVWRDDCGSNVLDAQTGTWIYNRAGWCPGDITIPYETDVTNYIDAGQTNTFDIDWENYTHGGGSDNPQYIIEALLFQYGAWNFVRDVSLEKVIKPSVQDRNVQVNPICNNPEVEVMNTGSQIVTKIKLRYWVEGSIDQFDYEWSGLLKQGERTNIVLPSQGKWLFGGKTQNIFHVEIIQVNQADDEYAQNNHLTSVFNDPAELPGRIIVAFTNNAANNQTKYQIINDLGDVVYSRTNSAPNSVYYDTISLDTGCYTMLVTDGGCDGLKFFANNDGNGKIWLHPAPEFGSYFPPLYQFEDEFGCEAEFNFTVGYKNGDEAGAYPTGTESVMPETGLWIYPNPAKDEVTIAVKNYTEKIEIQIINHLGQVVKSEFTNVNNGVVVRNLPAGNYFARVITTNGISTASFVILD